MAWIAAEDLDDAWADVRAAARAWDPYGLVDASNEFPGVYDFLIIRVINLIDAGNSDEEIEIDLDAMFEEDLGPHSTGAELVDGTEEVEAVHRFLSSVRVHWERHDGS